METQPAQRAMTAPRLAWFCDLEALDAHVQILPRLRDELGLTTVVPESHRCHTSGFRPSAEVIAASPVEGWRASPTLALHRQTFGLGDDAFAVLPGVVAGFDDAPLLRVIEACRRHGLEIWGHAGLWCYGGELFPDLAARDLFGRPLPPSSQAWGIGFCPSKPDLHAWIRLSLVDVVRRYDLDGFFLDHARYTSPGDGPSLLTCGCRDCAQQAARRGYDLDAIRANLEALRATLGRLSAADWATLARGGLVDALALLGGPEGLVAWFTFRARLLADQFADLAAAMQRAAGRPGRPIPIGSDVFPPSVALLGGHLYGEWTRGAAYLTGGFGERIGWGTVGGLVIEQIAAWLRAWSPAIDPALARRVVAHALGYDELVAGGDRPAASAAYRLELQRMAVAAAGAPVYPPVAGGTDAAAVQEMCAAIIDAGLSGAMFAGLERYSAEQRAVVARTLAARLF